MRPRVTADEEARDLRHLVDLSRWDRTLGRALDRLVELERGAWRSEPLAEGKRERRAAVVLRAAEDALLRGLTEDPRAAAAWLSAERACPASAPRDVWAELAAAEVAGLPEARPVDPDLPLLAHVAGNVAGRWKRTGRTGIDAVLVLAPEGAEVAAHWHEYTDGDRTVATVESVGRFLVAGRPIPVREIVSRRTVTNAGTFGFDHDDVGELTCCGPLLEAARAAGGPVVLAPDDGDGRAWTWRRDGRSRGVVYNSTFSSRARIAFRVELARWLATWERAEHTDATD